jgi:FkbM family methyltransferase
VNLAGRLASGLVLHTPLRDRRRRKKLVRARNRVFERLGSTRYARPSNFDVQARLGHLLPDGPGVFFEAGANDGYTQSNTYFLERCLGWTGVLVEGIPELAEDCRAERCASEVFSCALVAPEDEGREVTMRYGDVVSLVAGAQGSAEDDERHLALYERIAPSYEVEVPGRTLSSVLDEAGSPEIDLFFLDLEGYELEALRGMDFARHRPAAMVVEALDDERLAALEALLGAVDYVRAEAVSHCDHVFRPR